MEFIEYTIGELALEIKTGKTPPTSNSAYFDGDINWLSPSDLKGQKVVKDSERKITELAVEENAAFLFEPGTVMITTIGDIGRTCLIEKPAASNQQLTGIKVNHELIIPQLFFYWVQRSKAVLENKANKAVIAILNNKLLKQISVSFPKNIEDQRKVVALLNTIQMLIDKRVKAIQQLDQYSRSMFLELFLENPVSKDWRTIRIKDSKVIRSTTYGTAKKANEEGIGMPVLRMNNISYSGEILLEDLKWVELDEKELDKLRLENHHVLFNRTNSPDLVGKTCVWDKGEDYTYAGYLIRIILDEKIMNPYYFAGYFNSDFGKKVLKNKARLSGNLANISASTLMDQYILIPPIDLQKQYEAIYKKVSMLKEVLIKSKDLFEVLFKASLQSAFSEDTQINEEEVFESLLQEFTTEDLKQGERLQYLLNWLNCEESRFSGFNHYDKAWDKLRDLLEDGSIKQVLEKDKVKLKVAR